MTKTKTKGKRQKTKTIDKRQKTKDKDKNVNDEPIPSYVATPSTGSRLNTAITAMRYATNTGGDASRSLTRIKIVLSVTARASCNIGSPRNSAATLAAETTRSSSAVVVLTPLASKKKPTPAKAPFSTTRGIKRKT